MNYGGIAKSDKGFDFEFGEIAGDWAKKCQPVGILSFKHTGGLCE